MNKTTLKNHINIFINSIIYSILLFTIYIYCIYIYSIYTISIIIFINNELFIYMTVCLCEIKCM